MIVFHRCQWKKYKTIVLKIGSTSLITKSEIDHKKLTKLILEISELYKQGFDIVLITSGAISDGEGKINSESTIISKQAAAAVGQAYLISKYVIHFGENDIKIGQILLKRNDLCKKGNLKSVKICF